MTGRYEGTAIRSLEGAKASPKPAAGRYAPARTCQGSLRDPCGQTLDRTSPAQIPAATGLGEGWSGDRTSGTRRPGLPLLVALRRVQGQAERNLIDQDPLQPVILGGA